MTSKLVQNSCPHSLKRFFQRWPSFFLSALVLGFAAPVFAAPIVKEIKVEGNKKIESAAIEQRIQTRKGEARDIARLRDDIRALYSMGYFESIQAEEEDVAGGIRVVFVVREKPIVTKIEFRGLEAFDRDELKDVVEVREFEVLDPYKLNQAVERLTDKYEEKGYYLADVRYETVVDKKRNEATVIFHIDEHDKVQVKSINIIGNKVIPDDELKKYMQTREGDALSWLTGAGSYRETVFERDVATLGYYYGTLGYVRARFGRPEVTVSPDKKSIYITFSVDEGEQYKVGEIDFTGDLLFSRDELRADLLLKKGEVFNTDTLRRETLRYTEKYGDLGYAFANVVPQPVIHDETKTVDLVFEVDRGQRVYFGRITVTGNTKTKDKVVRRELKIQEGELFSGTKKRESRENVMRLGFFDNVEFDQETSKSNPHVVDIEIKVKERSTGQLVIGAGYASGNIGFTAQAQLSQNNFLGNGQVASLNAQVLTGSGVYDINLGFTEPYVNYSNWSLGGDLYHQGRKVYSLSNVMSFEERKTGFDVKLGHPVLEFTNLFLTYKAEYSNVDPRTIIDQSLIPLNSVRGFTSSLTASLVFDRRDDRFDPRNGWYWSASTEYAGLLGDRKFVRTRLNAKFFHPLFWDLVFRANVVGGNISETSDTPVPINELFIQGGLFSLRGYDFLSIGPRRRIGAGQMSQDAINANVAGKDIVIGGHNEVLGQAEIEFPILKEARIRGVVFFDIGNAFDGWFTEQTPNVFANFGYGIRWFTPIGPLRFEFGYPIVNAGPPRFYFTIGPPF